MAARGEVLAGLRFFDDKACALFVDQTVAVTAERFAKFFIDLYIVLYKINTVIACFLSVKFNVHMNSIVPFLGIVNPKIGT